MDKTQCNQLLESGKFVFAKSMPKIPHYYIVKETYGNDEEFQELVKFIRENGREERFFKAKYMYYYHNGFKYWTMGNPIETTRIINRASVNV